MVRIGRIPTLQEAALQYEVQSENYAAALKRINQLIQEAPRQERWLIQKGQVHSVPIVKVRPKMFSASFSLLMPFQPVFESGHSIKT